MADIEFFNYHSDLLTSKRVFDLAKKLDLEVVEKVGGVNWISFVKNGVQITNISFFKPQDAYAFLLGFAASEALKGK